MADELKRADVVKFLKLNEERLTHQRAADACERQLKGLRTKITAHVKKHGGKKKSVLTWGYQLLLEMVKGRVSWKNAYIDAVGAEKAEKLEANPPQQQRLIVRKAA